jgi:hypothetical protein
MAKSAKWDGNRSGAVELTKLGQKWNINTNINEYETADGTGIKGLMAFKYLGFILIKL